MLIIKRSYELILLLFFLGVVYTAIKKSNRKLLFTYDFFYLLLNVVLDLSLYLGLKKIIPIQLILWFASILLTINFGIGIKVNRYLLLLFELFSLFVALHLKFGLLNAIMLNYLFVILILGRRILRLSNYSDFIVIRKIQDLVMSISLFLLGVSSILVFHPLDWRSSDYLRVYGIFSLFFYCINYSIIYVKLRRSVNN